MAPGDLAGLDDDFPPEEGTPEVSEPSTSEAAPSETPAAPDAPEWTPEELDEWFENEVGGESGAPEDIEVDPHDPEFAEAVAAYKRLEPNDYAPIAPWVLSQAHTAWEQLSGEMKEQFRRGWARRQAAASEPDIDMEIDSVMDDMEVLPPIGSLPHDGPFDDPPEEAVIDQLAPYPPADGVPLNDGQDTSPAPGSFQWLVFGIASIVIAILVSITAVATGWVGFGGGTTTTVAAIGAPVTTSTLGDAGGTAPVTARVTWTNP